MIVPWTGYEHVILPLITTYHDKLSLYTTGFDKDLSVVGRLHFPFLLVLSFLAQYCIPTATRF